MTKRFLALLLAVAMIVTVFAGCEKTPADSSDNVSIVYETEYEYEYVSGDSAVNSEDGTASDEGNNDNTSSDNENNVTVSGTSSSSKTDKDDKTSSSSKGNTTSSTDKTNSDSNANSSTVENSNTNKTGFPIVKKKETITIMTNQKASSSTDYEDTEFTREYEKMTNMDIVWQLSSESQLKSKVTLALQSGNLPDIMFVGDLDDADMLRYSAEGSFVEITKDLLEEWAPNITAAYNENPEAWQKTVAPDGKMWSIASFSKDWNYAQHYLWVRTTWLKNLGISKPQTMDDFYEIYDFGIGSHKEFYQFAFGYICISIWVF